MLPKREIEDITLQINQRILGVEQYEFICLRLIDTIRQQEEVIKQLQEKLVKIEKGMDEIINDHGTPMVTGYRIINVLLNTK